MKRFFAVLALALIITAPLAQATENRTGDGTSHHNSVSSAPAGDTLD